MRRLVLPKRRSPRISSSDESRIHCRERAAACQIGRSQFVDKGRQRLLVGRYRKVIGPEMNQAFVKWIVAGGGQTITGISLFAVMTAYGAAVHLDDIGSGVVFRRVTHFTFFFAQVLHLDKDVSRIGQISEFCR